MAAAFPGRHRLTRLKQLTLKDLADETFILYRRPDGRGLYDVIVSACAEAGFSPHVGQEAPRIVSTLNLVAAGLGITIVPASLSRLPLEGVTYRPLTGRPAIKVPLNLACRSDERSAATLGLHRAGATPVMKPIKTIGHSNHPIERFVELLKAGGVERLVDVRSMPWSRRFPQFGRERLAKSLAEAGIAYAWEGEALGGKPKAAAAMTIRRRGPSSRMRSAG